MIKRNDLRDFKESSPSAVNVIIAVENDRSIGAKCGVSEIESVVGKIHLDDFVKVRNALSHMVAHELVVIRILNVLPAYVVLNGQKDHPSGPQNAMQFGHPGSFKCIDVCEN